MSYVRPPRLGGLGDREGKDAQYLFGEAEAGGYLRLVMGCRRGDGYKKEYVHRLLLWCIAGPPPQEGMVAMHLCENPRCCNVAHLVWGDKRTNMVGDEDAYTEALDASFEGGLRLGGWPGGQAVRLPR